MTNSSIYEYVVSIAVFIFAIMIHEVSHGWVAYKLGDPTAKLSGRLTLNPASHIDPIGTILFPIALLFMQSRVIFGWAKPVPINFMALRNPKKDIIWVGAAGPLSNIIIAFVTGALIRLFPFTYVPVLSDILILSVKFNLVLAAFNLIPIPPLDGSRILFGLLPPNAAMKYIKMEPYGFVILFVLLWYGLLNWFVDPLINILARIIGF